jgi:hypothetical protein
MTIQLLIFLPLIIGAVLGIILFPVLWYKHRQKIDQIYKEYLSSLQETLEEQELLDLIYEIEVKEEQIIHLHHTLQ